MDVVGRDERHARLSGRLHQSTQVQTVLGSAVQLGQQVTPVAKKFAIAPQRRLDRLGAAVAGHDAGQEPVGMLGHVVERDVARALLRMAAAPRDELRQAAVG